MLYHITAYADEKFDADPHEIYNPYFKQAFVPSAKLTKKVNAIDDLELAVNKDSWLYDNSAPFKTHVNVWTLDDQNRLIFRGRLIKVTKKMTSKGEFQKVLTFESILSYLLDTVSPVPSESQTLTVSEILASIINNHNKQIEGDKYISISDKNIDSSIDPNGKSQYDLDYKTSWDAIKTYILDKFGGYLTDKVNVSQSTHTYTTVLRYAKNTTDHKDIEVKIGKNMQSAEIDIDLTKIITRLRPLGSTQEDNKQLMNDQRVRARVGIADVNGGKRYIENTTLKDKYGIIYGTQIWDDVDDPNKLKQLGNNWMAYQSIVINNWKVNAIEEDNIEYVVGDRYKFVNPELSSSQLIRILEKQCDITAPSKVTLTIEDTQTSLANLQTNVNRKLNNQVADLKADNSRNQRRIKILQAENEQLRHDLLVSQGSGRTVDSGPTEPVNGDWGPVIEHAARLMNETLSSNEMSLIKFKIDQESSGNEKAINNWDSNAAAGHPSKGLLQYIDDTFNKYALEGHNDIWKGFDQLLALFNDSTWRSDLVSGSWGPTGARRYAKIPNVEVGAGAKRVQDAARKYLGVPYVWGGNRPIGSSPRAGMDCSSFVAQVYKDMGISVPPYAVTTSLEPMGHQISRSEVQTGDMGFYGSHGGSTHVTLALDNKKMIYEPAPGQSCMEQDINAFPPDWWIRNDQMAQLVAG